MSPARRSTSTTSPGFAGIITHELGHKIGRLEDEYDCYVYNGSDDNVSYTGPEPAAANVTRGTTLATIKWNDLIESTTPLPTTVDTPPGVVGIWEGAYYAEHDAYRPQNGCHMRSAGGPFCAVCEREMRKELGSHCSKCDILPVLCRDLSEWVSCPRPCGRIRWRIPVGCLQCGEIAWEDEILYELEGVERQSTLQVLDDHGQVIAEGRPSERGISVTFKASRSRSYVIELQNAGQTRETQTFRARLLRNGKPAALPAGR